MLKSTYRFVSDNLTLVDWFKTVRQIFLGVLTFFICAIKVATVFSCKCKFSRFFEYAESWAD